MPPPREIVFLLHGIGANPWIMRPLAKRLAAAGFEVNNWGYNSVRGVIEDHAGKLAEALAAAAREDETAQLHIVAHSMGSIVSRVALARERPPQLRRAVFLGPPHRGAPLAAVFGPWLKHVCRPIDQLAAREGSFVNCLAPPEGIEFAVIAASLDWLVPEANTHLLGECDHAVVRCLHTGLVFRDDVADMTANFLRRGKLRATTS